MKLPSYPFQRQRYWIEKPAEKAGDFRGEIPVEELAEELTEEEKAAAPAVLKALAGAHRRRELLRRVSRWQYGLEWQRQDASGQRERGDGSWLILADGSGVGEAVAQGLELRGERVVCVRATEGGDVEGLLQECGRLSGVVHLGSLDAADAGELTLARLREAQRLGCGSVLHLVQAVRKLGVGAGCRVWVVTRQAVETGGGGPVKGLAQSPVWGLGKVIGLEAPELWGGLMDVDEDAASVGMLVGELWRGEGGGEEISFRGGSRYVSRLVRREAEPIGGRWRASGEGAYLITGGTGVLGLRTAEWLVGRGARELVLTGRSEPGAAARAWIDRLRASGAEVRTERADAADTERMGEVVSGIRKLRGVVHAAGVVGISGLEQLTAEGLEERLRAKVEGSWVLHELTRGLELDLFVGYSSIASVWGSKGQAEYAAGNRFLDMLSQHRRGTGQAGVSVNWGPWSGGGMASEEGQRQLSRMGVGAIAPEAGLAALEQAVLGGAAQVTVADVNWKQFRSVYEARGRRGLLTELTEDRGREAESDGEAEKRQQAGGEIRERLETQPAGERRTALRRWLREQVAEVLGFRDGQLPDPDQGFFDMGMDSMLAVELKNRIEPALGVSLISTVAFDHPTVKALDEYLSVDVLQWHYTERVRAAAQSADAGLALADPVEVPDEAVEAEIAKKLARLEALVRPR